MFHFLTHFEGKFFTTLKAVIFHPGRLSLDYIAGIRKRYYKPVSFYLLIVILYLLFPLFPGLNMEMKKYKETLFYGRLATSQIEHKLATKQLSEPELAALFKHKSESVSKVLLFLLIPFTALILYLLYFKKHRWAFDNFILATEMNIFYVLVFFLILPPLALGIYYLFKLDPTDLQLIIFTLLVYWIYSAVVFRRLFSGRWVPAILKALAFLLLHSLMVQFIYKFFVFEVTLFLV